MASDEKGLKDWHRATEKYCDSLEEMVKELRRSMETAPTKATLDSIQRKVGVISRAGRSFDDDIKQAYSLLPSPFDNVL